MTMTIPAVSHPHTFISSTPSTHKHNRLIIIVIKNESYMYTTQWTIHYNHTITVLFVMSPDYDQSSLTRSQEEDKHLDEDTIVSE